MYFNNSENDGDDNEDDYEDAHTFGGRDGVIFLIDSNETMFDEHESEMAKFRKCLEFVEVAMMNRIICSEKDLVRIICFFLYLIISVYFFIDWCGFLQHKKQSTTKK